MAVRVLGVAAVAGVWQLASASGALSSTVAPSFWRASAQLLDLVHTMAFWASVRATFEVWCLGMAVTVGVGVCVGVLLGSSQTLYRWCRPTIEAIRPIPPIVILPLAIIILKAGLRFSAVLVVQGAIWPLIVLTSYGVETVPRVTLDTAKVYRLGFFRRMFFVRLAQALPFIGSGLRIAAATAFAVAIMVGLVAGGPGLGQVLAVAGQGFDLPLTFALTMAVGFFGLVVIAVFSRLERLLTRWKPEAR